MKLATISLVAAIAIALCAPPTNAQLAKTNVLTSRVPSRIQGASQIKALLAALTRDSNVLKQMAVYATADRGAIPPALGSHSLKTAFVQGTTYGLQTVPFSSVPGTQPTGPVVSETSGDGVRICTRVPTKQEAQFSIFNQYLASGNVAPGMIFTDLSVVQGNPSQVPGMARKAFGLTSDLVDFSDANLSNFQAVNAPYDLGAINQAVGSMLNRLRNSPIPARIVSDINEVHTAGQLKLSLNVSAGVEIKPLIGRDLFEASAGAGFSNTDSFDQNQVIASVIQPYFIISVANPPWELIDGPVSQEAVEVSNVLYGRMAIFRATSTLAMTTLKTTLQGLLGSTVSSASASASAQLDAMLKTGSLEAMILGGDASKASFAAVGDYSKFTEYVTGLTPTVQGALGVPLAYMFRYLSDDAPVLIKGVTQFNEVECRLTKRLKVTDASILVSNVVDFGDDEELFGTIKVALGNNTQTLWNQGPNPPVKKKRGESITINTTPEFRIDPALISSSRLGIIFDVKDLIEAGPEWLGASDQAKKDGYVTYSAGGTPQVDLQDLQNAPNGTLKKTYVLTEGQAEVRVSMTLTLVE